MRSALFAVGLAVLSTTASLAQNVTVVTPYLAQPGTQMYLEGFEAKAGEYGWNVNVIDTAGDVAAVISRIEDAVTQKADAIVINVDPAQVAAGLQVAAEAGIPVIGMDSDTDPLLYTNVTSNDYAMAAETAVDVANRIEGKGNVVMFVFGRIPAGSDPQRHCRCRFRQLSGHRRHRPNYARCAGWRHNRQPRQDESRSGRQSGTRKCRRRLGRVGSARPRRAAGD